MPSISKRQQKLFQLVLAVRQGKLKRDDVDDSVLKIVDSDMSDDKVKAFTKTLKEYLQETLS